MDDEGVPMNERYTSPFASEVKHAQFTVVH